MPSSPDQIDKSVLRLLQLESSIDALESLVKSLEAAANTDTIRTSQAPSASTEDSGDTESRVEFVELSQSEAVHALVQPADILWWNSPPEFWSRRMTIPVILVDDQR
jgi:hypothetical protein